MKTWLKKTFALSEQGAKDLSLSVFINTLFNLSLLLPVAVFFLLLKQWIDPLFGNSVTELSMWVYIGISIAILVIICLFEPIGVTLSNLAAFFISLLQVERVRDIEDYPVQCGEERSDYKGYDIAFENVKFSYDNGENVLNDVSFTAKQGEITFRLFF